jgi:hypothetical protein
MTTPGPLFRPPRQQPTPPSGTAAMPEQTPLTPHQVQTAQQQPAPQANAVPQADRYTPTGATVQSTLAQAPQPWGTNTNTSTLFQPPWSSGLYQASSQTWKLPKAFGQS